jgi:hypothetical protein
MLYTNARIIRHDTRVFGTNQIDFMLRFLQFGRSSYGGTVYELQRRSPAETTPFYSLLSESLENQMISNTSQPCDSFKGMKYTQKVVYLIKRRFLILSSTLVNL